MLYPVLKHLALGPVLRLMCRPKVSGRGNVPESGGALLVSNHLAVVDSFFLPLTLRRRVTFPTKLEYFTEPGVKGALKKWFFTGAGQVPIDRSSGSAAHAALNTCIRLLREGNLVGMYPEGTRSPDGRLYKAKTGFARIALEARVPVVPVAMIGTEKANPIGSRILRPHPVEVRFGAPLDFSRYDGLAGDRFVERSIADEVMYALMELSGQEYVDIYADKAKELMDSVSSGRQPDVPAQPDRRAGEATRIPDSKAG